MEQLKNEKKGWGHSSWAEGVKIAGECGVGQFVMFHHDPDSDDDCVDQLVSQARGQFPNTVGAAEGMVLEIEKGRTAIQAAGGSENAAN